MKIDRKQILISFLETISNIANKKYQKRVWICGKGPEVDDFTETVCWFFDLGDLILEKHKEYNLTEKQYQLLIQFRNAFEDFSDEYDFPEEFIDSREWTRITKMAKKVLKAFHYCKSRSSTS